MTRVLQHFTNLTGPPVGVWWYDEGGQIWAYYPEGGSHETHGRQVFSQKARDATWAQFFDALEEITPTIAGWESVEVSIDPREYLDRVRRMRRRTA